VCHVLVVEVVVAVLVLVGVAIVVSRDVPGLDEAGVDGIDLGLPQDRLLHSEDIDRLRLRMVAGLRGGRGYRFSDVDATLAAAQEALRAHENSRTIREAPRPSGAGGPTSGPGRYESGQPAGPQSE
jgi:hypothetical protein